MLRSFLWVSPQHMYATPILVLYMYKLSRHVNFENVTNSAFLQFYFQGSLSILLSDLCKPKFCQWNFEDENFTDGQLTMKSLKITSLEICTYIVSHLTLLFYQDYINQTSCLFVKEWPKQYIQWIFSKHTSNHSLYNMFLTCAYCCDTLNILSTQ